MPRVYLKNIIFYQSFFVLNLLLFSSYLLGVKKERKKGKPNIVSDCIEYSERAYTAMKELGVTGSQVLDILDKGRRISNRHNHNIKHLKQRKSTNPLVVTVDRSGEVNRVLDVRKKLHNNCRGVSLTYHAKERMKERKITQGMVHQVLAKGKYYYDKKTDAIRCRDTRSYKHSVTLVLSKDKKSVITVLDDKDDRAG